MDTDQNNCQIHDQHHQNMHKTCFLEIKLEIFLVPPELHKCRNVHLNIRIYQLNYIKNKIKTPNILN